MFRTVSIFTVLLTLTATTFAHEGHGHPAHQHGATHYVVNPSHVLPIVLTVSALIGLSILIHRTRRS